MNPVGWFEIPVTDMDRAKAFYEHVFQVKIDINKMGNLLMGWFPSKQEAPGSGGTLIQEESYIPSYKGTLVYFSVAEIEEALQRVESAGGKILNPKMSIGAFGFVGHFEDCEGNRVALHQGPQA